MCKFLYKLVNLLPTQTTIKGKIKERGDGMAPPAPPVSATYNPVTIIMISASTCKNCCVQDRFCFLCFKEFGLLACRCSLC